MLTSHESKKKNSILKYYVYVWVSLNDHPYSINSRYLLFVETTIIGKTDDLAIVKKAIIDTFHKEGKSQKVITERGGCSQSSVIRSDIFRKRATKPLLKQKHRQKHLTWAKEKNNWTVAQWSKVLFSDKSKFCISFGNQGLEEDFRGTKSKLLEVQSEVSEVSDDSGCRDVCWCWSIVFYQVQSQCSHCFHLLTSLMEMLISFSAGL